MKRIRKSISLLIVAVMTAMMLAGCGKITVKVVIPKEETYFTKGVYACFSEELQDPAKTYFYVFSADDHGYTADGENEGIGVPFDIEQMDGKVLFRFGGADEAEDVLVVTATEGGLIHGYFEDVPDRPLVFEAIEDADPDTFEAENYVNGPENSVYHDANGWSIHYDATEFEITQDGPQVFIVYTGESAGTNMITVTYTVDNKGKAAMEELGTSWGEETEFYTGAFPGAEYTEGYWAIHSEDNEGSGLYMIGIGRDFMDGALIVEVTGHEGEDEEMNTEVSNKLAGIIESFSFTIYSFDTIIDYIPDYMYYSFAGTDNDSKVLLVAGPDTVFDNGDGTIVSTEAMIYGYDENGSVTRYGYIAGGGTATPLAVKDGILFFGGHDYMNKVHLGLSLSEMTVEEGEFFDEYEYADVIAFSKASE